MSTPMSAVHPFGVLPRYPDSRRRPKYPHTVIVTGYLPDRTRFRDIQLVARRNAEFTRGGGRSHARRDGGASPLAAELHTAPVRRDPSVLPWSTSRSVESTGANGHGDVADAPAGRGGKDGRRASCRPYRRAAPARVGGRYGATARCDVRDARAPVRDGSHTTRDRAAKSRRTPPIRTTGPGEHRRVRHRGVAFTKARTALIDPTAEQRDARHARLPPRGRRRDDGAVTPPSTGRACGAIDRNPAAFSDARPPPRRSSGGGEAAQGIKANWRDWATSAPVLSQMSKSSSWKPLTR